MKIDIFPHIIPPKYKNAIYEVAPSGAYLISDIDLTSVFPTLFNLDDRFRVMDKFDGLMQVLTLGEPSVEKIADPEKAVDLAKLANDEMAELVFKYPDRFAAAVACLPMNNVDAALKETERAINDLKFRGIQISTPIDEKPLDLPEFISLYERMSQYNLPIWLHPQRDYNFADYKSEKRAKYAIHSVFGWPYETTAAMTRLVFSGILEQFPNLKFITHHCGGMVPYFAERIRGFYDNNERWPGSKYRSALTKAPVDYFRMFYCDTALYGNVPALMCAHAFYGAEFMLFGTDMPYDNQLGERYTRQTIQAIEQMSISDLEKKLIFEDNARRLLRLPI